MARSLPEQGLRLFHLSRHGAGELPPRIEEVSFGALMQDEDPGRLVPDADRDREKRSHGALGAQPRQPIPFLRTIQDDVSFAAQGLGENTSAQKEHSLK